MDAASSREIPARDLALSDGTALELRSETALSSRTSHAGDPVRAVSVAAAYADSTPIIPAGSEFLGAVAAIAPAPSPHQQGRLELTFTRVRIHGEELPIRTRVVSVTTHLKGRGVTGGTVAKVGAGALIGGIAGHVIAHSTAGTLIGAAAGGAAGGVVANATSESGHHHGPRGADPPEADGAVHRRGGEPLAEGRRIYFPPPWPARERRPCGRRSSVLLVPRARQTPSRARMSCGSPALFSISRSNLARM